MKKSNLITLILTILAIVLTGICAIFYFQASHSLWILWLIIIILNLIDLFLKLDIEKTNKRKDDHIENL